MTVVTHLAIGPEDHGVVIFAHWLARNTGTRYVHLAEVGHFDERLVRGTDLVHLHYTEALYAPHTTAAAQVFRRLRDRLPARVSVTLHDLPDPADESARYRRRSDSYGSVVAAVDMVCVSSRHEADLLQRFSDVPASVIPLPISDTSPILTEDRPRPDAEVAVFGFVYPGKGHEHVLRHLPAGVGLTALGRVADGHDAFVADLARQAKNTKKCFNITGFVPEEELKQRLRRVAVPVVPATAISASGSLNTWIGAGRRPLVAEGAYAHEIGESCPGIITLYRPDELGPAIRNAMHHPDSTWLEQPPPRNRTEKAVAEAYLRVFTNREVVPA